MKNIILIVLLISALVFTGCSPKTEPDTADASTQPSSETSPEATVETATPSPTVEITPSPEPTLFVETFDYIDDLELAEPQKNLFTSYWTFSDGTQVFTMNSQTYTRGIGMYISNKDIMGEQGSISAVWELGGKYSKITLDLGCEQSRQYDNEDKYGTYNIQVIVDGIVMFESGYQNYQYVVEDVEILLPEGSDILEIKLTEKKGAQGTLNVILGDFRLYIIQQG